MDNRALFFSILIPLSILLVVLNLNSKKEHKEKPIFSVYTSAEEANQSIISSNRIDQLLLSSDVEKTFKKEAYARELTNTITKKLTLPQADIAKELDQLENNHKELIQYIHTNHLTINRIDEYGPKLKLMLSFYFEINPENLSMNTIEDANLDSKTLYLLKTFSESKDFIILLSRSEMSPDFAEPNYLSITYDGIDISQASSSPLRSFHEM